MPAHSVNASVQDAAGDGDVEAGGEKRLAVLGLVFSTACLQRCQRNERAMRIRREKCLGWFTFPRGSQGHRLHRPLSRHLPFLPPGKVPGISAKTVHFPLWPTRAPAPQASLAALAVSPSGESAGNFGENGSLSPVARRGTGSTGISGGTRHFHLRGKCRTFPRKRFTFPRGRMGHRLHRPLSPHLTFPSLGKVPGFPAKTVHFPPRLAGVSALQAPLAALAISPPGKVPGFSTKMVHFPPWPAGAPAPQASLAALDISFPGESAGNFGENGSLSPVADKGTGSTGTSTGTWHFHPRGKCREFLRKRFTFPHVSVVKIRQREKTSRPRL